jgi:fucose 4-O-acetylase-like acetyltransferase
MMKKRLTYIDTAKFLAIFLMVLLHTMVPRRLDSVVHAFHMPVFFLLSGWVFSPEKYDSVAKIGLSRAKTLFVPYLFWGTVLPLLWTGFYYFYDPGKLVSLSDFLYALFYNNAESSPFAAVQWFLTCMFFTQLLGWAVLHLTRQKTLPVLLFTVLFGVLGWIYPELTDFRLPLALDVAFSTTAFFLLGWVIAHRIVPALKGVQKRILLNPISLAATLLLGVFLAERNGYVNMRLMDYGNPVLFYFAAILLSLALLHFAYYLSCLLQKGKWLFRQILFLGQNTLTILVLNQFFIQSAKLVVNRSTTYRGLSVDHKYALWFAFSLCLMVLMVPVSHLVNKTIPFSVGRKK